eukprot:scaffold2830_cov131-Cylindrotheca_fusiformis.AAC.17
MQCSDTSVANEPIISRTSLLCEPLVIAECLTDDESVGDCNKECRDLETTGYLACFQQEEGVRWGVEERRKIRATVGWMQKRVMYPYAPS